MIVFDLKCGKDHVFEAYFADSATYERQIEAREIACPFCGDVKIAKAPMAPNIAVNNKARGEPVADKAKAPARQPPSPPEMARAMATLRRMRTHIEQNFDHVGQRFPRKPARSTMARRRAATSTAMRPRRKPAPSPRRGSRSASSPGSPATTLRRRDAERFRLRVQARGFRAWTM